ncbi:hypothetical protein JTE90_028965 [Oedothorax gibbosus]|uniref:Uncharacterized protein n=1 Tax=Oedothorax gibbosus TaxID=931172 RepID=A0AAV6VK13_9ARAC|nr:hypothetical protein JTE90_028965 [Oedothorax gibbosus]
MILDFQPLMVTLQQFHRNQLDRDRLDVEIILPTQVLCRCKLSLPRPEWETWARLVDWDDRTYRKWVRSHCLQLQAALLHDYIFRGGKKKLLRAPPMLSSNNDVPPRILKYSIKSLNCNSSREVGFLDAYFVV